MSENPLSTPAQFLVSQAQLDSMTMYIYIGVGGLIAFFALLVYFIQDKVRTPKQAANLTAAHRKRIVTILLAGLDHFADLMPLKEFIPQVLETFPFGKGAQKRTRRFVLPQKVNMMETELSEPISAGKSEMATRRWMQSLNDLNNIRVTLRGMNNPMFVGVKNRSIAMSFPFASALSWTKDIEMLTKDPSVVEAMRGHQNPKIQNIGEILTRMMIGVSGVDFHAVYKNIDINYDPTIQDSISERDKTDGRLERSEDKEKPTKTILLLIMAIMGIGVIIVVAAKVL
jgi:hypothetical protein